MAEWHPTPGPFDISEVPDFVPRRLKPWLFIFFVLIIQFSGGLYLAAASEMVGTTALMQQDILMAGYASLIGMSINFAVMFRIKFRFSTRAQLIVSGIVLITANIICAQTENILVLIITCLIAGWFRMQATLACNSTIQLWLTPVRDMAIFFCYVYLVVDSVIQISGIATIYTGFFFGWEYMHWIMVSLLSLMILMVIILVRPKRGPMFIPLLGIDWIGALLWTIFMICFTFICVYGDFYDWWEAVPIQQATIIGLLALTVNLWRASFLHHPYISFAAIRNRNVIRATIVYLVFFTLLATEHVFEHTYAAAVLGFDEPNLIDLNWYVFIGIIFGCIFTYFTFARQKWSYRTMTAIGFSLAIIYLTYFYFIIGTNIEKEELFIPLFMRGASAVIISIIYLTSIVQSGLPFTVFPQALTINGFTGAVMGATLGPALIGEFLQHTMASNMSLLSINVVDTNPNLNLQNFNTIVGAIQQHSLIVSMKEIYGWLLIVGIGALIFILIFCGPLRPHAIFPKWKNIRSGIKQLVRLYKRKTTPYQSIERTRPRGFKNEVQKLRSE